MISLPLTSSSKTTHWSPEILEDNEEEEKLINLVVDKMENSMKLSVPVVVEYGSGYSWLEAH